MSINGHVIDAMSGESVDLRSLVAAMDTAVYVNEKYPYIIDPSGQATQFMKYQRGNFLMARLPTDMYVLLCASAVVCAVQIAE